MQMVLISLTDLLHVKVSSKIPQDNLWEKKKKLLDTITDFTSGSQVMQFLMLMVISLVLDTNNVTEQSDNQHIKQPKNLTLFTTTQQIESNYKRIFSEMLCFFDKIVTNAKSCCFFFVISTMP